MTKIFYAESRDMPREDPKPTEDGDEAGRSSDIDQQITDNLRRLYQATVDEELPPSLQKLLDQLQAQDRDDD